MTPINDKDRRRYDGRPDHDLLVELRVKVDYLETKLDDHCQNQREDSKWGLTTVIAVIGLLVALVTLISRMV